MEKIESKAIALKYGSLGSLVIKSLLISILSSISVFAQKAQLIVDTGHTFTGINSVAFSPDGKMIATAANDRTIKLHDSSTSKEIRTFSGHKSVVNCVAFSPDGRTLASGGLDGYVRIWNLNDGKELNSVRSGGINLTSVNFSSDGKLLITSANNLSSENQFDIWNVSTLTPIKSLKVKSDGSKLAAGFDSSGKKIILGGASGSVVVISLEQDLNVKTLSGHKYSVREAVFSPDGKKILTTDTDTVMLRNLQSGENLINFGGDQGIEGESPMSCAFSMNGRWLMVGDSDGYLSLWDVDASKRISSFRGHSDYVRAVVFAPDGKRVASVSDDNSVAMWETTTGRAIWRIQPRSSDLFGYAISSNGKAILYGNAIFGPAGVRYFLPDDGFPVRFSPAGDYVVGTSDTRIRFWNVLTGELWKEIETNLDNSRFFSNKDWAGNPKIGFSSDMSLVSLGGRVWSVSSGLEATASEVPLAIKDEPLQNQSQNGLTVAPSQNGFLKLADTNTGKILANLIILNRSEWAVSTPDGLFDSSPGARKFMHYVIGLEPINLDQMKDLYYVPGLLKKVLNGEPLPKVELFEKKDLFPSVEFEPLKPNQKQLNVKLTNRGGGIGPVQVLFNGKELTADARPRGFNPNSPSTNLTVDLSEATVKAGEENKIEVIARNAAGSLSTRGTRGSEVVYLDGGGKQTLSPNIYVIAAGISSYTGDSLKLGFAAKDAENFAKAIEVGATRLLGDKSRVHIRLLTSNGAKSSASFAVPDAKVSTATKADLERAFDDFKTATPNDVFIVYLAGHGVSLNLNQNPNQPAGDTYLYLTQEATTTDKGILLDEKSRRAMTISSDELKDLMKQNKALKQVLVLDTCAAGALSNSFVAKRDLPSDQIRAIERLKDNTGFYVLMGSSADAVTYEASQYGQGLLTYSLLQGMKGAKLRENQFADVNLLFSYAQETVPNMAKNIGGVQRPLIITPDNSASFDIGAFTAEEQKLISLANPKPLILRPYLQNRELDYDNLELTKLLQTKLREANYVAARGENSTLVYVDADEMVDAIKPSGSYVVIGDEVTVTLRLIKNKKPVGGFTVTGKKSDLIRLNDDLISEITNATLEITKTTVVSVNGNQNSNANLQQPSLFDFKRRARKDSFLTLW